MAPVAVQTNGANKLKRSAPTETQTNGATTMNASSMPSASKSKTPATAKVSANSVSERPIASSVRPSNRIRRDTANQAGRNSRNSAGLRSGPLNEDPNAANTTARPHVLTPAYILKKFRGRPPSLIVHLHPQHFRFDNQDGMFSYRSPMAIFLEHLKTRTVPHDLLEILTQSGVPFYDGCLIVQVHDHKSVAQAKDAAKPAAKSKVPKIPSIHKHNPYVTPSSYAPFAKDESNNQDENKKTEEDGKVAKQEEADEPASRDQAADGQASSKSKVFTVVLIPTSESFSRDLLLSATTPVSQLDGQTNLPQTPSALVPPTPTASSMPPPAKRQKREKMEMDPSQLRAAEGQILVATEAPLVLTPKASNVATQIAALEILSHPKHAEPPPAPKTRKRTVAEMAADEAAAAEQERYMLFLDERPAAAGAQAASGTDGDTQTGASAFEPTFERFKVIEQIKQEHAEKREQEKIKQQENDRKLQLQRQTQQTAEAQAQKQQNEAEKARRDAAALRERQAQQAEAQRQRIAAQQAANQNNQQQNNQQNGVQHGHPQQNVVMQNGIPNNGGQPQATNQAQARLQAQIAQAQAQGSSPVVRHGTPQNHSSPMVPNNSVPMQQTSSTMAASPSRPASVVQNAPMSVPMGHNMSARGSQQSHPSNTPRMPHGTPNMAHGTPVNRPNIQATPRMTQASPPPNMMAQNSQMGQNMMMNNPQMQQQMMQNPQVFQQMQAQQRAMLAQQQQQQHQQAMQGMQGMNGQIQGQGQMTPQQMQMMQMMRNQMMMQQQQQQQQHQGHPQQQPNGMISSPHVIQQYTQALQNMQGGNSMRQISPQMAQMQQQMARMNPMAANGMQRQVSNQMMNGQNPNMNAFTMQQMQQLQQQQQQQQQMQQQQQQQRPQQQINPQIQGVAKQLFSQMLNDAAVKFGSPDNIPAEARETYKSQALARANSMWHANVQRQRQAHAQAMQQQQQQQQQLQHQQHQQHQQQQAMQNMGGMMGHQGM